MHLSLVSLLAFVLVSSKCSWLRKAVVTCRQQQLPVLNWPIWSSHDYVTCSFRKHICGTNGVTNAFRGPPLEELALHPDISKEFSDFESTLDSIHSWIFLHLFAISRTWNNINQYKLTSMSIGMNNFKITSLPPPTTSEFHVVFQPFPSLPAIPGFLGSIPGTKEQGLEVDLESEERSLLLNGSPCLLIA